MKTTLKLILLILYLGTYLYIEPTLVYKPFLPPSGKHFFGTNSYGLDIFSVIFSSSLDLVLMCVFGLLSFALALIIGSTQGYLKGRYDFTFQRIFEVVISIPYLYIIVLVGGYFELNIFSLGIILTLFNWTFLIPLIRIQALRLSELSFITSMQNIGYSRRRILLVHVLPNVYQNLKSLIPFVLILFMSSLTSLDFLGLVSKSNMSVGSLIFEGVNYLEHPFILVSALSFICVVFISLLAFFNVNKYYDGV